MTIRVSGRPGRGWQNQPIAAMPAGPPAPDLAQVSAAVGRPIELDPDGLARRTNGDASSVVLRDGSGVIAASWIRLEELANIKYAFWLRRRVRGVGDEAYRVRVGGGLVARRGRVGVNVSAALHGHSRAERDRVAAIVANACLAR